MNELNAKDDGHKKAHGIPCPKCSCTKWTSESGRAVGQKFIRVRVCKNCTHRIRTCETMNSASVPRLYARDPVTHRKKPTPAA